MMKNMWMRLLALTLVMMTVLSCVTFCAMAEDELRGYNKKNGYVYVQLGTYPQTAEGEVQPILWRVLSVEKGKAYLCSEYVLDARRMHGDYKAYADKNGINGEFPKTELGMYLNGEFMTNFTAGELALIAEDEELGFFTLMTNTDLKDKSMGFGSNNLKKAWGTEWAKVDASRGDDLFVYGSKYGSHSPYWLRDQSTSDDRHARCTKDQGEVGHINVITVDLGMRPVCYLDMSKVQIAFGTGTMEDPFVLATKAPAVETQVPVVTEAPVVTQTPIVVEISTPAPVVTEAPAATEVPVIVVPQASASTLNYVCVLNVPAGADPAAWLARNKMSIQSGSGTAEDPFILVPSKD